VINTRDKEQLYRIRRRLGMLFQFGALFTDLTVFENVAFPLREHSRLPESMIRDIVLMKLNAVGLRGAAQLRISEVSGGMARRIALARAIALDPELIMYDEPFAGLDPISMGVAANLIRRLNDATGATSLIVSHDVQECFLISDYAYLISSGRIVARGTPAELKLLRRARGAAVHSRRARRSGAVPLPGAAVADRASKNSGCAGESARHFARLGVWALGAARPVPARHGAFFLVDLLLRVVPAALRRFYLVVAQIMRSATTRW
jgi:ABC-type multidrug transport system ATPase subunit